MLASILKIDNVSCNSSSVCENAPEKAEINSGFPCTRCEASKEKYWIVVVKVLAKCSEPQGQDLRPRN